MNVFTESEQQQCLQLVDIIDLKWLLAREGLYLHVQKLQQDPHYAARLLALALQSPSEAVREAATRVQRGRQTLVVAR